MDNIADKYEAPSISEIATLHELTLDQDKDFATVSDGFTFHHIPIANAS